MDPGILAPSAPGPLQRLLARLVQSDPRGVSLELGASPHARAFLAAFSDRPGKLDELLPPETQERLAKPWTRASSPRTSQPASSRSRSSTIGRTSTASSPTWRSGRDQAAGASGARSIP